MNENPPRFSPSIVVLLILAIATALKAAWALNSIGSMDVLIFWKFGNLLQTMPMRQMYETYPAFNHPPLTGFLIKALVSLCNGQILVFAPLFRCLSIFADIGLVLGLLHVKRITGRPPWWAVGLFAASPVSIMISGFHGNTDPIMVMFVFFALIAVLHDRPALSGAFLALAFNIKIIPLILLPAFVFYWWARNPRAMFRFILTAGGGFLLGAALPLIQCPAAYTSHVLGYGSVWGVWGVTFWLRKAGLPAIQAVDFRGLSHAQQLIVGALKALTIAGVTYIAWLRRKVAARDFGATLGAVWTVFFVFAPGVVVQYMAWPAVFVLLLNPRAWIALTAGSTLYLAAFYHPASQSTFPWYLAVPYRDMSGITSNLPWAVFIFLLVSIARTCWLETRASSIPAGAAEPSFGGALPV